MDGLSLSSAENCWAERVQSVRVCLSSLCWTNYLQTSCFGHEALSMISIVSLALLTTPSGHGTPYSLTSSRCVTKRELWSRLTDAYPQTESFTPPVDHHNTTGEFNASVHGFHGPVLTTLPGAILDVDPRVVNVTNTNPSVFPFNLDMNAGNTIGIGA